MKLEVKHKIEIENRTRPSKGNAGTHNKHSTNKSLDVVHPHSLFFFC